MEARIRVRKIFYTCCAVLTAFLFIVEGILLAEQDSPPDKKNALSAKSYTVGPATSEIRVDGVLDEQAWADAAVGDLSYEWLPAE